MRSFGRALAIVLVAATLGPVVYAQSASNARDVYNEALKREAALRRELESHRPPADAQPLLRRIRTLVGAYADMARIFPVGGSTENALWQGALLSADAFWQFGEDVDRTTALNLLDALSSRFPGSALNKQAPVHVRRLTEAQTRPAPADAQATTTPPPEPVAPVSAPTVVEPAAIAESAAPSPAAEPAPPLRAPESSPTPAPAIASPGAAAAPAAAPAGVAPAAVPAPPPAAAPAPPPARMPAAPAPASASPPLAQSGPALLTGIRREVLPDALRVTLELERSVTFQHGRLEGPPRVFIDLQNTTAPATLNYTAAADDVAGPIRIGRQPDTRIRVVLDLLEPGRYRIHSLADPYRIVIDVERLPQLPAGNDTRDRGGAAPPAAGAAARPPIVAAAGRNRTTPPPAVPAASTGEGYSLSRQLGLGAARIVIDPGHGGRDPGAQVSGLSEAELVLDVALRLEALLRAVPGLEVVLTRRADAYLPLEERTAIANRVEADLFLSIHANASANPDARGVETYFLNFAPDPEAEAIAARENVGSSRTMRHLPDIVHAIALNNKINESRHFAAMVQAALYDRLRRYDREVRNLGVKQAPFVVLIGATMPSVLAEISFLTHREEAALLRTEQYRQQIAEALFTGVITYQQSLK